jgi:Leucine-rich repeat (LRR) protein
MLRRTRGFVEAPVNVLEPTHTSVSLEVLDLHDYGIEELPLPKRDSSSRGRSVQPWRIIFLQRNRITMFDGLAECANLRKLDLSSNCITALPNRRFWAFLPNLQVLLLHDNKLEVLNQLLDLVCNSARVCYFLFCCDFSSHQFRFACRLYEIRPRCQSSAC